MVKERQTCANMFISDNAYHSTYVTHCSKGKKKAKMVVEPEPIATDNSRSLLPYASTFLPALLQVGRKMHA